MRPAGWLVAGFEASPHELVAAVDMPYLSPELPKFLASLRRLLSDLRVREVRASEWSPGTIDPRFALNINRPEDLDAEV
ncbi:MAG TPA: hypothetical protein VGR61_00305 [Candidatus Dormibacteraeota bacterium]|nr:hypothetical protein [Candidatus Dormibacteraeota bacterium]